MLLGFIEVHCTDGIHADTMAWSKHVPATLTVFIQIDAHAQIDAHPLHQQALSTQTWVKLVMFYQKVME